MSVLHIRQKCNFGVFFPQFPTSFWAYFCFVFMNNLSEPSAPTWWSFLRKMSHREQKSRKSAFDQKIVKIGYLLHWYGSPSVGAKLGRKNNGKSRPFCMKVKNAACATSISQWDMSPKVFIGGSHPITNNCFYRGPVCNWPTKKLGEKMYLSIPRFA